jgi:hypothetical protein
MSGTKKRSAIEIAVDQVNNADSVEELEDLYKRLHIRDLPLDLDFDDWKKIKPKDLFVLEAVVIRLRELIESGKLEQESEDEESEDDEENREDE